MQSPAADSGLLATTSGPDVSGNAARLAKEEEEAQKKIKKAEEEKKKKETKVPKPVNFKRKAEAKCNLGRSTITDSRYWTRIVKEDLEKPQVEDRKACLA